MLKIKVKIEDWRYNTEKGEFTVKVKYILPVVGSNELHPLLRAPIGFLNCLLHPTWKWIEADGEGRVGSYTLSSESLKELIRKLNKRIKEEINILKRVVRENRAKIKEVKQMKNEEKVYLI